MSAKTIKGWHFIHADRRLAHEDARVVVAGEWLTVDGPLKLCEHGLHASRRAIDALGYLSWEPAIICRVEVVGDVVEEGNKMVARRRRVLWMAEADGCLHQFALDVATEALREHYPDAPDTLWTALDLRAAQLAGIDVPDEDMAAARASARDAAWTAASAAAWASARDAASAAASAAARDAQNIHLERLLSTLPRLGGAP